jgi:hypothetical protein
MLPPRSVPQVRESALDELLTAVDLDRGTGDRSVRHEVDGQRGDVGRGDEAPDRKRHSQLLAARRVVTAEVRRRERRVDEADRDQVHAYRREFEREALRDGAKGSREGEARHRRPTGGPQEEQRPARPNVSRRVSSDAERHREMRTDVGTCRLDRVIPLRHVAGARTADQYVVDRSRKFSEEPSEPLQVRRIEGRDARSELESDVVQTVRFSSGEDHVGPLHTRLSRRLESDARATADHQDGLAS